MPPSGISSSCFPDSPYERLKSGGRGCENIWGHPSGMTSFERRFRIVFEDKLDHLGDVIPPQDRCQVQPEVYARGDAPTGHAISIHHETPLVGDRSEIGQEFAIGLMRGGPITVQQSGCREDQGSRADAGDIGRLLANPRQKGQCLGIFD